MFTLLPLPFFMDGEGVVAVSVSSVLCSLRLWSITWQEQEKRNLAITKFFSEFGRKAATEEVFQKYRPVSADANCNWVPAPLLWGHLRLFFYTSNCDFPSKDAQFKLKAREGKEQIINWIALTLCGSHVEQRAKCRWQHSFGYFSDCVWRGAKATALWNSPVCPAKDGRPRRPWSRLALWMWSQPASGCSTLPPLSHSLSERNLVTSSVICTQGRATARRRTDWQPRLWFHCYYGGGWHPARPCPLGDWGEWGPSNILPEEGCRIKDAVTSHLGRLPMFKTSVPDKNLPVPASQAHRTTPALPLRPFSFRCVIIFITEKWFPTLRERNWMFSGKYFVLAPARCLETSKLFV